VTTTSDNLAIMDTFVNQEIVITTHTDYVGQPSLRLTGTLRNHRRSQVYTTSRLAND